jgi:hypothetical protein
MARNNRPLVPGTIAQKSGDFRIFDELDQLRPKRMVAIKVFVPYRRGRITIAQVERLNRFADEDHGNLGSKREEEERRMRKNEGSGTTSEGKPMTSVHYEMRGL